jgi:sulfur-oxidizing protein SoxA
MKKLILAIVAFGFVAGPVSVLASPKSDLRAFKAYFKKRFPKVKMSLYKDGIYALDADRRAAWLDWVDFAPPYSDGVEQGKRLFRKKFKNGKSLANCFKRRGIGIRQNFPYFDRRKGKVVTLEGAINECRIRNKEKPWKWGKGKLASVSAYMASTSKGKRLNIKISKDPRSLAIYERGKRHFYAKRGQLNFSCADCHVYNAGNMARGNLLSPALGHVTHFPVWRKKWAKKSEAKGSNKPDRGFGTIQRRYGGCNKQVRAKPFKGSKTAQNPEYVALEYFHSYMSSGLKVNGPGLRQ